MHKDTAKNTGKYHKAMSTTLAATTVGGTDVGYCNELAEVSHWQTLM